MQRLISSALNYVVGGFSQGAENQTERSSTRDRATATSPIATSPTGYDGTNELNGSKKRPITVGSPELKPRKKVDLRSDHEKRLTGNYGQPKTALRLSMPGAFEPDEHEESPKPRTMGYKPRGGHKPVNTLAESRHAANTSRNNTDFFKGYASKNQLQTPAPPRQPTESRQKQIQPPPAPSWNGDGFDPAERVSRDRTGTHPNKRQKLDMVQPQNSRTRTQVDLTEDDEDERVTHINGVRVTRPDVFAEKSSGVRNPPPELFGTAEVDRVHAMTQIQQKKRRRKSADGQGSSQASSRGTPAGAVNGHSGTNGRATQQMLDQELIDNEPQEASTNTRPPINLGSGMNEVKDRHSRASNNRQQPERTPENSASQPNTNPTSRPGQLQKPNTGRYRKSMLNSGNATLHPEQSHPANLRTKFVRDVRPVAAPRQTAPQRMKAESRVSPITDGDDSPDELARGTTVGSQASRSASPQKRSKSSTGDAATKQSSMKSPSPGDLRPTKFTQGGRLKQLDDRRAAKAPASPENYQDTNKVRIAAFYATRCVITLGELMLQYDEREKQFDLLDKGVLQVLRGKKCAVSFGEAEARTSFTYVPGGHRVYLKGSSYVSDDGVSNGNICIAFLDSEGVKWFMDLFMEITDDRLKRQHTTEEKMDLIFKNQIHDIQMRYSKYLVQQGDQEAAEAAETKRAMGEIDEEILYDLDHTTTTSARPTSAARLKREGQQLLQKSPYFDNPGRRRSSRTTRQVKQLSSTLPPRPKWTQLNKPQRWSHSVVYPPEGLRRVTVDFQDLERLDEGEFLNDNIISYALRRIEENISPEHKEDVFFFNSFFYTALTSKNGRKSFNYDAVKRWTKNKDIFTLPYVVVPINIDLHWFVAIICNLPSVSHKPVGLDDDEQEVPVHDGEARNVDSSADNGNAIETPTAELADATAHTDAAPSSQTMVDGVGGEDMQAQTAAMDRLSISQEEEDSKAKTTNEVDDLAADNSDVEIVAKSLDRLPAPKKTKKKAAPPPKKYDPDLPTIITLDSFGTGHSSETRNLKDYLKAEAEAKRSMDLDTKELQGMTAKGIPEQTNFCDCGLYLVGYVEEFAKNPRQFVTKVLTRQLDKQADFASFNPSAKREELRNELLKLNEEQDAARKLKKSEKKSIAKGIAQAPASSPTPAPPKSTQQQVKTPQVDNRRAEGRNLQSKQSSEPTTSTSDPKRIASAAEDEELEECVPRALTEPVGVQKIETSSPPQRSLELPQEVNDQLMKVNGIDITTVDDTEEMLDTADEPIKGKLVSSAVPRTATDPVKSSDIMAGLEQELNKNQAELLHRESMAHDQITADAETHSNVQFRPPREHEKKSNPTEVIHLDESNGQLEVPESPAGAEG